ncbi:hypothetical protein WAI453_007270 [Rhynchosporium graminicola]
MRLSRKQPESTDRCSSGGGCPGGTLLTGVLILRRFKAAGNSYLFESRLASLWVRIFVACMERTRLLKRFYFFSILVYILRLGD